MGLLEEAISEFQRVAKSADKDRRFAMRCNVAPCWASLYGKGNNRHRGDLVRTRAPDPGLDQESILALRYDLGVAQERPAIKPARLKSFSQVYAMNIDYRTSPSG